MLIFGYYAIACEEFHKIQSLEEVDGTQGLVWFDAQSDAMYELSHHCLANHVPYAVRIENIKGLLIYAALNAKYVIVQKSPEKYQKIAEEYLLDTKILCIIEEIEEIEEIAKMGVDGVILAQHLLK
ncbi:hypothetical protein [Helicobacter mustelae]|uniref:Uncharacterized protein n=1 Tax=Helicobacter mustelae (strain ATCC 43772 / CCUG 25715 / CIP 103759 / LMG 18044 / NCTC 12198 / R85-136P) TaxID=679897 RepID=D3UFV6_HELM1|nr:hypothetical protein [Helicobacter mustelae]CBG39377.1 Putative hypothetical protein [Helicobacter mustelae 12198]SQH70890.1 Uncharacterised protein [Helicobacter mustelae]STP12016.1 Uncharacterised protein [Helicobacter mustelae]